MHVASLQHTQNIRIFFFTRLNCTANIPPKEKRKTPEPLHENPQDPFREKEHLPIPSPAPQQTSYSSAFPSGERWTLGTPSTSCQAGEVTLGGLWILARKLVQAQAQEKQQMVKLKIFLENESTPMPPDNGGDCCCSQLPSATCSDHGKGGAHPEGRAAGESCNACSQVGGARTVLHRAAAQWGRKQEWHYRTIGAGINF